MNVDETPLYCDECGWRGKENHLNWHPFNPIDTFLGTDKRNETNKYFEFTSCCPNCGSKNMNETRGAKK